MSDAGLLRQAAALMRERAQAASPSPWQVSIGEDMAWGADVVCFHDDGDVEPDYEGTSVAAAMAHSGACTQEDAAHIASWHPAVALAVAEMLDDLASFVEYTGVTKDDAVDHALVVARAYLGGGVMSIATENAGKFASRADAYVPAACRDAAADRERGARIVARLGEEGQG